MLGVVGENICVSINFRTYFLDGMSFLKRKEDGTSHLHKYGPLQYCIERACNDFSFFLLVLNIFLLQQCAHYARGNCHWNGKICDAHIDIYNVLRKGVIIYSSYYLLQNISDTQSIGLIGCTQILRLQLVRRNRIAISAS